MIFTHVKDDDRIKKYFAHRGYEVSSIAFGLDDTLRVRFIRGPHSLTEVEYSPLSTQQIAQAVGKKLS